MTALLEGLRMVSIGCVVIGAAFAFAGLVGLVRIVFQHWRKAQ